MKLEGQIVFAFSNQNAKILQPPVYIGLVSGMTMTHKVIIFTSLPQFTLSNRETHKAYNSPSLWPMT